MPISDSTLNSEQKLLWRTWKEKSRRVDMLAEKRMTVLFLAVGLILAACVLYYALRAKAAFDPNQQNTAASSPIVWFHLQHGRNLESDEAARSLTTARVKPEVELDIVNPTDRQAGALV
jgi:hypothetical protein